MLLVVNIKNNVIILHNENYPHSLSRHTHTHVYSLCIAFAFDQNFNKIKSY